MDRRVGRRRETVSGTPEGYRYPDIMRWDPNLYGKYLDERSRPAHDLIRAISHHSPAEAVDLGCGSGHLTALLADMWPMARVTGIDNSHAMLEQARTRTASVDWIEADIGVWAPTAPPDVIFSNAALHWIDDHSRLFPKLAGWLAPGGVLAVQVPANHDQPTHQLAYDLAGTRRWAPLLSGVRKSPVFTPPQYGRLLLPLFEHLDIWQTTYLHILDGDDPVSKWVEGSFLRGLLEPLTPIQTDAFLEEYRPLLRSAYPAEVDGTTFFPFTRTFIVGRA